MAVYGCKHPCFRPDGADSGVVIGRLVSANNTVTLASGELYANDELTEEVNEFSKASIAMETDDMVDSVAAIVYGATVSNGTVTYKAGDSAPQGGLAYYKVLMRNGVKRYKGYYYPSAKAALGNDNVQTKGSNITFQTTSTTFTIKPATGGAWRETKEFSDEASAEAWVESMTGVAESFLVSVSAQGTGTGKSVDKTGDFYVASGSSFAITIEGDPTALYDNGEEKSSAISGGTYTVSGISADHTIAVIF